MYGLCGNGNSYVSDWADIPNIPDDLWVSRLTNSGYYSQASVYSIPCVSDSFWSENQRIHQYAANFNDTYGEVTINIDSDVIDGAVEAYGSGGLAASASAPQVFVQAASPEIQAAQPLAAGQGWALVDRRLTWLDGTNSGRQDITPAALAGGLLDAAFTDARHGWAAGLSADGSLALVSTENRGVSWQAASLPGARGLPPVSAAWLSFAGSQNGWLSLRFQSSAAFSLGSAYRTQDGGRSWQSLSIPAAGQLIFADPNHGWLAGGASGGELYATGDGGASWKAVSIPGLRALPAEMLYYASPVDLGGGRLLLPVTRSSPAGAALELFTSNDWGATWAQAPAGDLSVTAEAAGPVSLVPAGAGRFAAGMPDGSLFFFDAGGNVTGRLGAGALPAGWADLRFAGPDTVWARTLNGECSGGKPSGQVSCIQRESLLESRDGAKTWTALAAK